MHTRKDKHNTAADNSAVAELVSRSQRSPKKTYEGSDGDSTRHVSVFFQLDASALYSLKYIGVELILARQVLDEDQQATQGKRNARIDEGPLKTDRSDERRAKPPDNYRLPSAINLLLAHQHIQLRAGLRDPHLIMCYVPVQQMRGKQLAQIEICALFEKFSLRGVRGNVPKGEEHDVGKVHARNLGVEHARRGLNLRLESMGRCTKHHETPCKLHDELLSLQNLCDM